MDYLCLVCEAESITDQVVAQEQLRASLRERESMLKETHHRVKNHLQVIAGLLSLQAASVTQPDALDVLTESQHRVHAMALLHKTLYGFINLGNVDLSRYLGELCGYLFRSYRVNPARPRLELNVEAVNVPLDKTIRCGLLVNEIVSNSVKHALPDDRAGKIIVRVRTAQDCRLHLTLADDGVGMPIDLVIDQTLSLGLRLIPILTEQLSGELTIKRSEGTRFELLFSQEPSPNSIVGIRF